MTARAQLRSIAITAVVLSAATVVAAPCPAIAIVVAPPDLRAQVVTELAARAVQTSPRAPCPAIVARLAAGASGIVVSITDADARRTERQIADVATAAAWIASWARADLDAMLLAPRPADVVVPAHEDEQPPGLVRAAPALLVSSAPHVRIALDASTAIGSDGSLWLGMSGLACVRFGPACAGVLARASQDTEMTGDSERFRTARRAVDLMVALDVPRAHEGWSWTPGVQVGLALNRSTYAPEIATSDMVRAEIDGGSLRAGAHVAVATQLGERWALALDVAVDAALFSPADPVDGQAVRIAGPPEGFARAALQLRYGEP